MSLIPIQPLSLVVQSLIRTKITHELTNAKQKVPQFVPIEEETFFNKSNITMSNNWVHSKAANKISSTSDNTPVPCILWDDRLRLSFPTKRNIMDLVTLLRPLALSWYWKRVTKSLLACLRTSYFSHYLAYLAGQRYCHAIKERSTTGGISVQLSLIS